MNKTLDKRGRNSEEYKGYLIENKGEYYSFKHKEYDPFIGINGDCASDPRHGVAKSFEDARNKIDRK